MVALPALLKLVVAVLCVFGGRYAALRLHERRQATLDTALRHAPWLGFVGVVVALDAALAWLLTLRPDLTWSLPLWMQYWATAVNWAVVLGASTLLFAVTLTLAHRTRDVRGWPLLVVAVGCLAGIEWYQSALLVQPVLGDKRSADGGVLQTSGNSCGAASGANVARWFGISASEREMARRFGTSAGTSAAQIVHGMREIGVVGRPVEIDPKDIARLKPPAVLFLEPRTALAPGHIVTFVGVDHDAVVILDPLEGRVTWQLARLPHGWRGRAIEFSRM